MHRIKILVNSLLRRVGYQVVRYRLGPDEENYKGLKEFDAEDKRLWKRVRRFTMTSPERIFSLRHAVEYLVAKGVTGDFVECGVWRGGSAMTMALCLLRFGDRSRNLFLYDTYDEGWPPGNEFDVTRDGVSSEQLWQDSVAQGKQPKEPCAQYDKVRQLMASTGYPEHLVHMIKGKVEDTIPDRIPEGIALLRLDTDWYESTRHEFEHLFPRLVPGGVLIVDDYGFWQGARKATDEYFAAHGIHMLLHRIDAVGSRIGIKQ